VVDFDNGPEVGNLLSRSDTSDVVDAHLVVEAIRRSEPILTGDVHDLETLTAAVRDQRLTVMRWP